MWFLLSDLISCHLSLLTIVNHRARHSGTQAYCHLLGTAFVDFSVRNALPQSSHGWLLVAIWVFTQVMSSETSSLPQPSVPHPLYYIDLFSACIYRSILLCFLRKTIQKDGFFFSSSPIYRTHIYFLSSFLEAEFHGKGHRIPQVTLFTKNTT